MMAEERTRRLPTWMVSAPAAAGGDNNNYNNRNPTSRTSKSDNHNPDGSAIARDTINNGKKKKKKSRKRCAGSSPLDFDLTVQDLLSIAHQYVKADEDSRPVQPDSEIPTTCGFVTSQSHNQQTSSTASSSGSGDPAQDMLHLFLGPLLKKPMEHQNMTKLAAEDMASDYELKNQTKGHVGEGMDTIHPLKMKKRSSLRDKVSSLLNPTPEHSS